MRRHHWEGRGALEKQMSVWNRNSHNCVNRWAFAQRRALQSARFLSQGAGCQLDQCFLHFTGTGSTNFHPYLPPNGVLHNYSWNRPNSQIKDMHFHGHHHQNRVASLRVLQKGRARGWPFLDTWGEDQMLGGMGKPQWQSLGLALRGADCQGSLKSKETNME